MKKISHVVLLVCLLGTFAQAQDTHFSQFWETPLQMNPGNTALNHDLRAVVNYRRQWGSFVAPFQSFAFSFDAKTSRKNSRNAYLGVGVHFLHDQAGNSPLSITEGGINLSGVLKLNENNKLSLGLMGGFGQRSLNVNQFTWSNQYVGGSYNPNTASGENFTQSSVWFMDAGAGLVWSYGKDQTYISANDGVKLNVGVSAFHFNLPKTGFLTGSTDRLRTKYTFFLNSEFGKNNSNFAILPQIFLAWQARQTDVVFGSLFRYILQEGSRYTGNLKSASVSLGALYRLKDAMIWVASMNYANYSIGFSYDMNVSKLSGFSKMRGGFELFLKFVTPNPFSKATRSRI
jgi:type IX secretion system PorP/SprF family membrane protein